MSDSGEAPQKTVAQTTQTPPAPGGYFGETPGEYAVQPLTGHTLGTVNVPAPKTGHEQQQGK